MSQLDLECLKSQFDQDFPARKLDPIGDAKYVKNRMTSRMAIAMAIVKEELRLSFLVGPAQGNSIEASRNEVVSTLLESVILDAVRLYRILDKSPVTHSASVSEIRNFKRKARKLVPYRDYVEHREDPSSVNRKVPFPTNIVMRVGGEGFMFQSHPLLAYGLDSVMIGDIDLTEICDIAQRLFVEPETATP